MTTLESYPLEQQLEDCRDIAKLAIEIGRDTLRQRDELQLENTELRRRLVEAGLEKAPPAEE